MTCPKCNAATGWVQYTRKKPSGAIERRRQCTECKYRWTTVEIKVDDLKRFMTYMAKAFQEMKSI